MACFYMLSHDVITEYGLMCELVIANVTLEWFDALVNDSDVMVEAGFLGRADGTAVHRAHEASSCATHF